MPDFLNQPGFRNGYLASLLAGGAVLAALVGWAAASGPLDFSFIRWPTLLLAATAGFILRSLRRRLVIGPAVSIHSAIAFEAVIQTARAGSPWLPLRPFEAELLRRESGAVSGQSIQAWFPVREASPAVALAASLSILAGLYGFPLAAWAAGLTAAAVFGWRVWSAPRRPAVAAGIAAGLAVWGAEGWLMTSAVQGAGSPDAWILYFLFTGLLEFSPVPLGLGFLELPVLLMPGSRETALPLLLAFHAARLAVLLPLSLIYLNRFKLTAGDLMTPAIIGALRQSRRPPGGWPWQNESENGCPELSLVIPAYNEERRLPGFLDTVDEYLREHPMAVEIVVVDDGSGDRTAELAAARPNVRLLRQSPNQGKGAAVRRGMLESRGLYILFADADGATPITELERFRPAMAAGAEIVIGSRKLYAPGIRRSREGWRELMGNAFYSLVNLLAVPGIADTQCGFKLFHREVARRLFSRTAETGWAFDVEVLYLAQRCGFAIREVAVNWQAVEGSKVRPVRDSWRMFLAIFRIRARQSGFIRHTNWPA